MQAKKPPFKAPFSDSLAHLLSVVDPNDAFEVRVLLNVRREFESFITHGEVPAKETYRGTRKMPVTKIEGDLNAAKSGMRKGRWLLAGLGTVSLSMFGVAAWLLTEKETGAAGFIASVATGASIATVYFGVHQRRLEKKISSTTADFTRVKVQERLLQGESNFIIHSLEEAREGIAAIDDLLKNSPHRERIMKQIKNDAPSP